ncbi:hypothetical protein LE190_14385 [Massilia oculi]|uniref:Type II secretion system protein n=1 Tax=Massilia hydrophila TaxID=3044279 RepID=A0ABS7YDW3_9BURK|nr:hypothetical protein [Massilia oculi]MCA1857106.1 hypothetical protein [Massilia oculi]
MSRHSVTSYDRATSARGGALLVLLALVSVAALTALVGVLHGAMPVTGRSEATARAMAEAKQALLAWAASNDALPGQLPCPEDLSLLGSPEEGKAMDACTLPAIGRLPWRTLGLPDLRDANRDKLWYALSPGFRSAPINSATPAQLSIDGVANSAVAIVLSPGAALSQQARTPGGMPVISDYLEDLNRAGGGAFVTRASQPFNDVLLPLTSRELMRAVEARVSSEVGSRLRAYFNQNFFFPYAAPADDGACKDRLASGFLPASAGSCTHPLFPASLPAPLAALPGWFAASNWHLHLGYQVAAGCVQSTPGSIGADGLATCGGAARMTIGSNASVKASITTSNRAPYLLQ